MKKQYLWLVLALLLVEGVHAQSIQHNKGQKANIVFILCDDMGYETVGYNKVKNYKTPNIDALAQQSTVFTNCDAQPLCVPSRVKLITGQYNYRNYTGWGSFNLEIPALGQMMKQAGYKTAAFGKWHLSKTPEKLGFDEYSLFNGSPGDLTYAEFFKRYYYNCPLLENDGNYIAKYSPDRFNERALQFLEKNKNQPFFLYYPMSLSHNPFQPTPDSKDQKSTNWQHNFEDMIAYSDKLIGKVVAKLKELGIYENTVIIYAADNGTKTLAHYMEDGTTIYGGKGIQIVDGVHVPLFIKYDGKHKMVDDLVDLTDFYPTLADLAGSDLGSTATKLDGVSLLPLLKNKKRASKPYIFSTFYHPLTAYIRDKQFKFYYDGRLYDIQNDPRELKPFYDQNDTHISAIARKKLKNDLIHIFENSDLSSYPTKQKLKDKFGDFREPKSKVMLGGFIFDDLEYTPRKEKINIDVSDFLSKNNGHYKLRVSRNYLSSNSGLTYADAVITGIKIIKNGKGVRSIDGQIIKLTTRRDYDLLKEKGNPIISFIKEGDNSTIDLGALSKSPNDKIELEIETEVSNPDNQWGDRIELYFYLDKNPNGL